jgi:hypothetical protein
MKFTLFCIAYVGFLANGFQGKALAYAEVPAQTRLAIYVDQMIDSKQAQVGQEFAASLADDVVVDGDVLLPKGTPAKLRLVENQASGRIAGRTSLKLVLWSLEYRGKLIEVTSSEFESKSSSRGKSTAKKAGIFGGLAALGCGVVTKSPAMAAACAAAGAGGGTAISAARGPERVQIDPESRLSFVLQQPLPIPEILDSTNSNLN